MVTYNSKDAAERHYAFMSDALDRAIAERWPPSRVSEMRKLWWQAYCWTVRAKHRRVI